MEFAGGSLGRTGKRSVHLRVIHFNTLVRPYSADTLQVDANSHLFRPLASDSRPSTISMPTAFMHSGTGVEISGANSAGASRRCSLSQS